MLDLTKLAQQMRGISDHLSREATAAQHRVATAQELLQRAIPHQESLLQQLQEGGDRISFLAAQPIEPLDTRIAIDPAPEAHTTLATDGSQIAPSHHEIAYCYLINTGRVMIPYGQSRYPLLDSLPEVVYRPEDLYQSRQWGISIEEWMGYRRTVAEAVVLAELAEQMQAVHPAFPEHYQRSKEAATPPAPSPPTLAMVDGSLIYWFLEPLPALAREQILPPILAAWETLKQLRIPMVGYLSASRSSEALNFLRLESCPFDTPDCLSHCNGQADTAPCQNFAPLRDVAFWASQLEPGERGPLWRSSADILSLYGDHSIYFCHVHVGAEVARLEMPQWVVEDPTLLNTALQIAVTQVQKGYGYPVVLAEAHNQAVVRGGDRTCFFALLEQEMVRAGLQNIGTSYKAARKRGSIA